MDKTMGMKIIYETHELSGCSPAANAIDLNPMDIRNTTHLCL
jgi:hypothetical protein